MWSRFHPRNRTMANAVSSPILQLIRQLADDQGVGRLSDQHLLRQFSDWLKTEYGNL